MSEVLTLAEDPIAQAKLADIIAAQQLTEEELEFLVPDDFVERAFEPLPYMVGLAETVFLGKYTAQAKTSQPETRHPNKKIENYVNQAPAEYTAKRYTTGQLMGLLGL